MKKKIYFDMILNLAAAGFPLIVLQVIIYPLASRSMDADTYGLMIALYALMLLINDSLGRAINNVRLISNDEEENKKGDYNIILIIFGFLCVAITFVGVLYYYKNATLQIVIMIVLTSLLMLCNSYLNVYFRIRLRYGAILLNAIVTSIGFLLGFFIYTKTNVWIWIFLMANVFSFLYLACYTKLLREPFKKTERLKSIFVDTSAFSLSLFLSQGITQADKLLLFPLLGGEALSVYYTASLAGKIVSLAITPVNSVILSYIAKKDYLSNKVFKKYLAVCFSMCLILSIVVLVISEPILSFLFPKYVEGAMKIIPLTTLNIFLLVMSSMITPIVMKFCDIKWQLYINAIVFVFYIVISVSMLKLFGLVGFCLGIGVSYFIRLLLLLYIYKTRRIVKE